MSTADPRVSVFMPVYNGEPFLAGAIESVLTQTFTDLELVIVENGSSDGSRDTARDASRRDPRVRLIEHARPLGIVGAGNAAVAAARAALVARQDQDDLSHPRRLERQVACLDRAPEAVVVGTLCDCVDATGRRVRPRDRWRLVGCRPLPPFPHGSACMRRSAFERAGGYRDGTHHWEDVDLFLRLVQLGPILVLPEALYRYRFHARSLTASTPPDGDDGAALMWQVVEEYRRGADWTHLLDGRGHVRTSRKVAARAGHHQAGTQLWSGVPLQGRAAGHLTTRARLRHGWQRTSPGTLRAAMWAAIRIRDLAAAPLLPRNGPVRWRPR